MEKGLSERSGQAGRLGPRGAKSGSSRKEVAARTCDNMRASKNSAVCSRKMLKMPSWPRELLPTSEAVPGPRGGGGGGDGTGRPAVGSWQRFSGVPPCRPSRLCSSLPPQCALRLRPRSLIRGLRPGDLILENSNWDSSHPSFLSHSLSTLWARSCARHRLRGQR